MRQETNETEKKIDEKKGDFFVQSAFVAKKDKATKAMLARADNPALAYQSWEFMLSHGVSISYRDDLQIAGLIAASIARSAADTNGSMTLGRALASIYDETSTDSSSPARMKLRRMLACGDVSELVAVLRPVLRLIEGRLEGGALDYEQLRSDLMRYRFDWGRERVRVSWAQQFYGFGEAKS